MLHRFGLGLLVALYCTGCQDVAPNAVGAVDAAAGAISSAPGGASWAGGEAAPALPTTPSLSFAPVSDPREVVRLTGKVSAPNALDARTTNVKNGRVVGSPIRVTDALTGKTLKQGVTYYDGSFQIDVPASVGSRPLLVKVSLVDDQASGKTLELATPLTLSRGQDQVSGLTISPETTALVTLYRQLSPQSKDFAHLVASTTQDATLTFASLARQNKAIQQAASVGALDSALKAYVSRTVQSTKR
jgi:hypothetical protein